MVAVGYHVSTEEHTPSDLLRYARGAEEAGFSYALVSDHYHPWLDRQGHSPFVWSLLGGMAQVTERMPIGTGVTCPIMRIHPAIIAQAAATTALMMPGRFFLGLGTGEHLNEHILGDHWPRPAVRLEMLDEAIEVIRLLWSGETVSYEGAYYTVEDARIYDMPDSQPPLLVAASGPMAARLAGEVGYGVIALAPDERIARVFQESGGEGKPRLGKVTVCWSESRDEALRIAYEQWTSTAVPLPAELRTPADIAAVAKLVRPEDVEEKLPLGPDPEPYLETIRKYVDAGYDHVYLHQIGPDQEGFFRFFAEELRPRLETSRPHVMEMQEAAD